MKFSVIIPVFNGQETIKQSIYSVLNQTYKNFEIIVINDGSTDNTKDIVEDLSNKNSNILLINQDNKRQGAARNKGLETAQGDFIVFLDSDDILHHQLLRKLSHLLEKEGEDLDVIFYGGLNRRDNGDILKRVSPQKKISSAINEKQPSRLLIKPSPAYACYKKEFLLEKQLFFMERVVFEDIDFAIRVAFNATKSSYLDGFYYNYYIHNNSTVRSSNCRDNLDAIKSFDNAYRIISSRNSSNSMKSIFNYLATQYLLVEALFRIYNSSCSIEEKTECAKIIIEYFIKNFGTVEPRTFLKLKLTHKILFLYNRFLYIKGRLRQL